MPSDIEGTVGCLIAHWRYATTGSQDIAAVQPFVGESSNPVLAHNGQFLLPREHGRSDTEIVFRKIQANPDLVKNKNAISGMLGQLDGAFSLVCYVIGRLIAARDAHGLRPLFIGAYEGGAAISSETRALEMIDCRRIDEFPVGHWAMIQATGAVEATPFRKGKMGLCAFEHVYFHSRNGKLGGQPVRYWRKNLGRILAEEMPVRVDVVAPVPHSGWDAGEGFAEALGMAPSPAIQRTDKAERTFIASSGTREQKLAEKFRIDRDLVNGKEVCLVDDSVVRGTTLRFLSKKLRGYGASAVHARIAAPKFRYPCFFGIDVPSKADLPVNKFAASEVAENLGLDSLEFLSVSGLHLALGFGSVCTGCFTSRYPISAQKIRLQTEREEVVGA